MVSLRQGLLTLAALAALLLSGCASGFHDAGVPQASVYDAPTQPAYPPVEKYPVTQARVQTSPELEEISVTDLQPSPQQAYQPNQSVVFEQNPPPTYQLRPKPQYQEPQANLNVAALIQQSRANYSGNCGCPYDRDSAGRKCGGRSAYSRAGGASVLCYPSDVTAAKSVQSYSYNPPAQTYTYSPPVQTYGGATGYGEISTITGLPRTNYVSGYYRKNGTYVKPYYRSKR